MNHRGIVFPITAQSLQPRWQTERQMPEGDRMRQVVDRKDVQRMVAEGAQLVDVLPPREYENDQLGAFGHHSLDIFTINDLSHSVSFRHLPFRLPARLQGLCRDRENNASMIHSTVSKLHCHAEQGPYGPQSKHLDLGNHQVTQKTPGDACFYHNMVSREIEMLRLWPSAFAQHDNTLWHGTGQGRSPGVEASDPHQTRRSSASKKSVS